MVIIFRNRYRYSYPLLFQKGLTGQPLRVWVLSGLPSVLRMPAQGRRAGLVTRDSGWRGQRAAAFVCVLTPGARSPAQLPSLPTVSSDLTAGVHCGGSCVHRLRLNRSSLLPALYTILFVLLFFPLGVMLLIGI